MKIKILIYLGYLQNEPQKIWNINEIIIFLSKSEIPKPSPIPIPVINVKSDTDLENDLDKLLVNQIVNPFPLLFSKISLFVCEIVSK